MNLRIFHRFAAVKKLEQNSLNGKKLLNESEFAWRRLIFHARRYSETKKTFWEPQTLKTAALIAGIPYIFYSYGTTQRRF